MEFTLNIKGLDTLAAAIAALANALSSEPQTTLRMPVAIQAELPTAPVVQPQPTQPTQQQIPTNFVAQEYTLEQIQLAMSGLIDAGKIGEVSVLMQSFGVAAIMQLPRDQYPPLVLKLREMGAQI